MVRDLVYGILLAYALVHVTRVVTYWAKRKNFSWDAIFLPGGMPSAHSALVSALAAGIFLEEGWTTLTIAVVVFAGVVVFDAMTLRREVSVQKMVLDKIHLKLIKKRSKTVLSEEHIGHTPMEVIVGVLVGILGPVIVYAL